MVLNSNDRASIMLARPQGGFFAPVTLSVGDGPVDFTSTDIDDDGRDDLIVGNAGVPYLMMIYNNADRL